MEPFDCAHFPGATDVEEGANTAYADSKGYINVQELKCAALAGTWQEDADRLTTWYSGWYNGLAKKHYFNIARSKELEREVIVYCKAHPEVRIIEAIDVMLKQEKHQAVPNEPTN